MRAASHEGDVVNRADSDVALHAAAAGECAPDTPDPCVVAWPGLDASRELTEVGLVEKNPGAGASKGLSEVRLVAGKPGPGGSSGLANVRLVGGKAAGVADKQSTDVGSPVSHKSRYPSSSGSSDSQSQEEDPEPGDARTSGPPPRTRTPTHDGCLRVVTPGLRLDVNPFAAHVREVAAGGSLAVSTASSSSSSSGYPRVKTPGAGVFLVNPFAFYPDVEEEPRGPSTPAREAPPGVSLGGSALARAESAGTSSGTPPGPPAPADGCTGAGDLPDLLLSRWSSTGLMSPVLSGADDAGLGPADGGSRPSSAGAPGRRASGGLPPRVPRSPGLGQGPSVLQWSVSGSSPRTSLASVMGGGQGVPSPPSPPSAAGHARGSPESFPAPQDALPRWGKGTQWGLTQGPPPRQALWAPSEAAGEAAGTGPSVDDPAARDDERRGIERRQDGRWGAGRSGEERRVNEGWGAVSQPLVDRRDPEQLGSESEPHTLSMTPADHGGLQQGGGPAGVDRALMQRPATAPPDWLDGSPQRQLSGASGVSALSTAGSGQSSDASWRSASDNPAHADQYPFGVPLGTLDTAAGDDAKSGDTAAAAAACGVPGPGPGEARAVAPHGFPGPGELSAVKRGLSIRVPNSRFAAVDALPTPPPQPSAFAPFRSPFEAIALQPFASTNLDALEPSS